MPKKTRPYTADEVQARVLNHVRELVDYWQHVDRPTEQERMNGLAFSILVMLDGGTCGLPKFTVSPDPHPDDKTFHEQQGENYYEPCDIAGSLHEAFYRRP